MAAGSFNIYGVSEILGQVTFTGANDYGPKLTVVLPKVMFRPSNPIGFINEDTWGQLQVTGEVLVDDTGIFGTVTHPDTAQVSPLTSQYYIGKGVVTFLKEGDVAPARDIGNVPVFEFAPNVTTLPHFSSRLGVRTKDLEIVLEKSAALNMTMDEWTYDNLMLTLLGEAAP